MWHLTVISEYKETECRRFLHVEDMLSYVDIYQIKHFKAQFIKEN